MQTRVDLLYQHNEKYRYLNTNITYNDSLCIDDLKIEIIYSNLCKILSFNQKLG